MVMRIVLFLKKVLSQGVLVFFDGLSWRSLLLRMINWVYGRVTFEDGRTEEARLEKSAEMVQSVAGPWLPAPSLPS